MNGQRTVTQRVLPALQGERLYEALTAQGWICVPPAKHLNAPGEIASTWTHPGISACVSWVDDQEYSKRFYGLVYGDDAAAAVARLSTDAWLISPERGIASIQEATTIEHLGTAARSLGILACGAFQQEVFDVLVGMLQSGNAELQMDALTGVMFSAWPQFDPVLQQLASDPTTDQSVREEAQEVLSQQRETDWNADLR